MLHTGSKTVAAAGTPEPLAATRTPAAWALVQAKQANTGYVTVKDVGGTVGVTLASAGDSILFPFYGAPNGYDLAGIYVDVQTGGEGVDFSYAR